MGFQGGISGKESTANAGDTKEFQFLSPKDPMESEVATHSLFLPGNSLERGV